MTVPELIASWNAPNVSKLKFTAKGYSSVYFGNDVYSTKEEFSLLSITDKKSELPAIVFGTEDGYEEKLELYDSVVIEQCDVTVMLKDYKVLVIDLTDIEPVAQPEAKMTDAIAERKQELLQKRRNKEEFNRPNLDGVEPIRPTAEMINAFNAQEVKNAEKKDTVTLETGDTSIELSYEDILSLPHADVMKFAKDGIIPPEFVTRYILEHPSADFNDFNVKPESNIDDIKITNNGDVIMMNEQGQFKAVNNVEEHKSATLNFNSSLVNPVQNKQEIVVTNQQVTAKTPTHFQIDWVLLKEVADHLSAFSQSMMSQDIALESIDNLYLDAELDKHFLNFRCTQDKNAVIAIISNLMLRK